MTAAGCGCYRFHCPATTRKFWRCWPFPPVGTPTVALTKFDKSVLAQNADIRLYISAPEATPRSGAMSSRIAQMVAVDVLFTAVAHLDYDRAAASLEKSRESCRPHRVDGAPPLRRRY